MQTREYKQRQLTVLMLLQLSTGFSMGMISPILGIFVRSRGLSLAQVGLVGTASMLGWFIWEPIMGAFSDRFNKRLMLAGSVSLTMFLYMLYPRADSLTFFVVLDFARSSIMSAYSIPVKVFAAEFLPIEYRGRAYGRYMMIVSLGGLISPLIGGFVSEVFGLSTTFYLAASTGVLGIIAVYNLKSIVPVDSAAAHSLGGLKSILTSSVIEIFAVRGIYFFNAGFMGNFVSIFLNEQPQFLASESQVGAFFTLMRLVGTASRSFVGDMCDKVGNKPIITGSLVGIGLTYIGLIYSSGLTPMYLLGALQGLFQSSADTSMMLQLIEVMPKARSGLTMGLYSEAENIGGLLSTPSLGLLYQNLGADSSLWLVILAMFLNASFSYIMIRGKSSGGRTDI
jgi:DHA1 family bicyclomycin/chloramphenicol resistance-like MFS transporter